MVSGIAPEDTAVDQAENEAEQVGVNEEVQVGNPVPEGEDGGPVDQVLGDLNDPFDPNDLTNWQPINDPVVLNFFRKCWQDGLARPSNAGYTQEEKDKVAELMKIDHDLVASGLVNKEEDPDKWEEEWNKSFTSQTEEVAKIRKTVQGREKDESVSNWERFLENVAQYANVYLALHKEQSFSIGDHIVNLTTRIAKTETGKGCTIQAMSRKKTGVFE